jgi:ribonuclease J
VAVQLTVFDGSGCIGGNKIYLLADGVGVFFDFGLNFSARSRYFDEFLRPRSALGLLDYLKTGLLPPIPGIYRHDLFPPGAKRMEGFGLKEDDPLQLQAVLLSHAHSDHLQMISFLQPHIPIYSSLASAVIAKARQDTGSGNLDGETTSIIPKEEWEGLLRSSHYRTSPALGRIFKVAEGQIAGQVQEFWATPPSARALQCIPLESYSGQVGNLNTLYFPVDHSIPGSGAWAVETSEGWVVYTGDLRLHGARKGDTLHFVAQAARLRPLALICEGTHLDNEWFMSEAAVYENARLAVELSKGLVIADFSLSNMERLALFYQVALDTGRILVVTFKDAYLLEALSQVIPDMPSIENSSQLKIYGPNKVNLASWERALAERYSARMVPAQEIQKAQAAFILCFGYYDLPNLLDIEPRGGLYLHSSSEPFHEQMILDMGRLQAWLDHFQIHNAGHLLQKPKPSPFHSSGHIGGHELLHLIEQIRPRFLIPVHTEKPHRIRQMVQARLGKAVNVILPKTGHTFSLKG